MYLEEELDGAGGRVWALEALGGHSVLGLQFLQQFLSLESNSIHPSLLPLVPSSNTAVSLAVRCYGSHWRRDHGLGTNF